MSVERSLEAKRRREVDDAIRRAYGDAADDMASEIAVMMDAQAWPRGPAAARVGACD